MVKKIDMKTIRYINLFEKISRVHPKYCFSYNSNIIFCVPARLVSKAIGEQGKNVKKVSVILNKRVKVVQMPENKEDIKKFISVLVHPVQFREIEINDEEVIITAGGMQNKAMLLGRNKAKLAEMKKIIRQFFNKEFRVV